MSDHDQRFKELLKRFIEQFFRLFLPDWLPIFEFDQVAWLDKYYPDPPQGKRPRLDLVGKVRLADSLLAFADERDEGHDEAIIHIEIESDDSSLPIRKRDYRYYNYLRDKHDLPVLPIVLHLNVALDGLGRTLYEEGFRVVGDSDIVLAENLVGFRYFHIGLRGLPGPEYLAKNEILGVALSALMQIPQTDRPLHQAKAIKRIVESGESEYNRYMLAECVHAYMGLTNEEWARTQELLRDPIYSGTAAMITEVYRRTLEAADAAKAEAALQTRRADLTRLLQYKFPKKFDEAAAARLEAVDSQDTLSLWFGHALQAESWKDFAKAAGWRGENGHANGDGPEFEL